MVQQLSLVSVIPESKYHLTISTLKAFTGMSPLPYSIHTLLTKPIYEFRPKIEPGKINQIEQYIMKVITTWDDVPEDENETKGMVNSIFRNSVALKNNVWTFQISDIPSGGKRTTSSQTIFESTMTSGDINEFLTELGYTPTSEYWSRGVRFFHNDIIIEIVRISIIDKVKLHDLLQSKQDETEGSKNDELTPIKLLDSSGHYLIRAFVNIARLTEVESINKGNQSLNNLKNELVGLFDLEIPDRMVMDSRISNRQIR